MSSFTWQWQVFLLDIGDGSTYLQWLFSAWGWTLAVAGAALVLALLIGSVMGTLRTTPSRALSFLGTAWSEVFRNVPLLVQVFCWYHVLPSLVVSLRQVPTFLLVVCALGFFTSARVADQVRAGLLSLPRGQRLAGQALGMSLPQTYRHVLLPMGLRVVLPTLTSEAMSIVKNSSVAFAVGISELTLFAMQAQEETSRGIEVYLSVTALYFTSAYTVSAIGRAIERRVRVPGTAA